MPRRSLRSRQGSTRRSSPRNDVLASKVRQALWAEGATPRSSGELPRWTLFGSRLHLLRHLRNDAALSDLARVYVRDCLARWVPEVELVEVVTIREDAMLKVRVRFDVDDGALCGVIVRQSGRSATDEEDDEGAPSPPRRTSWGSSRS